MKSHGSQKISKEQARKFRKLEREIEHYTFRRKLWYLLTNVEFMLLLFSLTGMYFVCTGIQYWITDYFEVVLGVDDVTAFISFAFLAVTGPVLGCIAGGVIFTKVGGYQSPRAFPIATIGTLGAGIGCLVVFMNNYYVVVGFLWV